MHNLKSPNKNTPAQSLIDFISKHRDIADYFRISCPPAQYEQLAVQLIRQAIGHRGRHQKHYNVAYVKHNRFLSPSQKQDVAYKVTEIIPVSQQPIKIYGKPKVKLDDQYITPAEQVQQYYCQQQMQGIQRSESQRILDRHLPQSDIKEKQRRQHFIDERPVDNQRQNEVQNEEERCLNPRTTQNIDSQKQMRKTLGDNKEEHPSKSMQNEKKKKKEAERPDKKQEKIDLKIQSNFKTTMKPERTNDKLHEVNSPKNGGRIQKYEEVESKIKFMIDRDKKNKKLENKLEEQSRKIQKLQQRQERLLLRQYQQSKDLNRHTTKPRKQMPCCCSSDEEITSKLLQMRNLQNYSSSKMLSNLHSKISPIKSYKISANPVYPMTSSDSSDSSDQEVMVAVR